MTKQSITVRRWDTANEGALTESALRAKYPADRFRVSASRYPPQTEFGGAMRQGKCHVVSGAVRYVFESEVTIRAGEVAELPEGRYSLEVIGDDELLLIMCWELPCWITGMPSTSFLQDPCNPMSAPTLAEDARVRPDLFHWNGRMDPASMRSWLESSPWLGPCPSDLLAFWQETGGGDVFETETILGPMGDRDMGDDIAAVNRELRSRGMPERFVVFHLGSFMGAVDTASADYVGLDPSNFQVRQRFGSLDEWYRATLRKEFRQRYGL